MSSHHVLSETEMLRLPPMLFGSIQWHKGLGTLNKVVTTISPLRSVPRA
jgi:hypothetical protein